MPVARLLGEERKLVVAYWLGRLKDLPASADRPLEKRLTVRDDGLLTLDLSGTKIADLAPLAGMPLGELNLLGCGEIADFAPLRELRSLTSLELGRTRIGDLSPLRGLPLVELRLASTRVSDISPLRGMPLKELVLWNTHVTDFSPLAGMPLATFSSAGNPATDYSPLKGAPLDVCVIQDSQVSDLSFLDGSPVRDLSLYGCDAARGFAVLGGLKSLRVLVLPQSYYDRL